MLSKEVTHRNDTPPPTYKRSKQSCLERPGGRDLAVDSVVPGGGGWSVEAHLRGGHPTQRRGGEGRKYKKQFHREDWIQVRKKQKDTGNKGTYKTKLQDMTNLKSCFLSW